MTVNKPTYLLAMRMHCVDTVPCAQSKVMNLRITMSNYILQTMRK